MAKLTKKQITKVALEAVATEFNSVILDEESGIQMGKDVTKDDLQADVIEVAGIIEATDLPNLSEKTLEVLSVLKVELPGVSQTESEVEETDVPEETEETEETEIVEETEEAPLETKTIDETIKEEKAATKVVKKSKKKPSEPKNTGPGIIASILEFIKDAPKTGVSIENIHVKLTERFPEREATAMLKTVKAQIGGKKQPCRMEREKKVTFKVTNGQYSL